MKTVSKAPGNGPPKIPIQNGKVSKKRRKRKKRSTDGAESRKPLSSSDQFTFRNDTPEKGIRKHRKSDGRGKMAESIIEPEAPALQVQSKKRKKRKEKSSDVGPAQSAEENPPTTSDNSSALVESKAAKKKRKRQRSGMKSGGTESSVEPNSKAAGPSPVARSKSVTGNKQVHESKRKSEKFRNSKNSSLRERMLSRLSAARFRFINEELYTWDGEGNPVFAKDPKSFSAYHSGFKQQTKLWPINPIDVIIKSIKRLPNYTTKVIADFGCGEAKLAHELSSNKVFSFDLVALNDKVTVADNANVNLYSRSVDIAVHCLSLMSSKISAYVKEAHRVLKTGGLLKVAEVESRFEDVDRFIADVCKFNFKLIKKDLSHNLFYFLDFEKLGDIGVARKRKLPSLSLQPCLYKKR